MRRLCVFPVDHAFYEDTPHQGLQPAAWIPRLPPCRANVAAVRRNERTHACGKIHYSPTNNREQRDSRANNRGSPSSAGFLHSGRPWDSSIVGLRAEQGPMPAKHGPLEDNAHVDRCRAATTRSTPRPRTARRSAGSDPPVRRFPPPTALSGKSRLRRSDRCRGGPCSGRCGRR